tara:strand:+ start:2059 stop:3171 length:1113 start_codon:yes stop_codon:yes gene_type:complete
MIILFILSPFIIYLIILLFFCIVNIIFKSHPIPSYTNIGISIIIAIRDGEKSLNNLIHNLLSQDYQGSMEFILVDDESTDNTKKIIFDIANNDSRFQYLSSIDGDKNLKFKKKALDLGIRKSQYNHLIFTDVDCDISSNWVSTMASYFSNGFEYLVGYSLAKKSHISNIVSRFQRMDLLILMIMCRGSAYFSSPWAATGQNQGFTKELYHRVGGFIKINKFLGDDTPFLQLCKSIKAKVAFIDNASPQILCRQEFKISTFLLQRARWVFDANQIWRINIIFFMILIITFIFYITIPLLYFISFNIIFQFAVMKFFLEGILVYIGSIKYSEKISFFDFLIWELFHIPYIITVGIMSFLKNKIQWRGRKLVT